MKKIYLLLLLSFSLPVCAMDALAAYADENGQENQGDNARVGDLDEGERDLLEANITEYGIQNTRLRALALGASQLGEEQQEEAGKKTTFDLARYLKAAGVSLAGVFVLKGYNMHAEKQRKAGKPTILERFWRSVRGFIVRSKQTA